MQSKKSSNQTVESFLFEKLCVYILIEENILGCINVL